MSLVNYLMQLVVSATAEDAMRDIITIPGIGGSGKTHWQTRWEEVEPRMRRFAPSSWDQPQLEDWIGALDREVAKSAVPPVLVVHSLSCLLVSHWALRTTHKAGAALLVAPPDPASAAFPPEAFGFANPPSAALPFPSLIVASSDDPFGSIGYAKALASGWGSEFIEAGALGHINGSSGLGAWRQGREALAALEARLG